MIRNAVTVILGVLLAFGAYHEGQVHLHIGAPPLPYHCPAGSHVVRHWAPRLHLTLPAGDVAGKHSPAGSHPNTR
jgi:hypothetical protein